MAITKKPVRKSKILELLTDMEKVLRSLPYQAKLITRVGSGNYCLDKILSIRKELSAIRSGPKPKWKQGYTHGFVKGKGYHSKFSGNFHNFLGMDKAGNLHFYRRFSHDWDRLSAHEALNLFDPSKGEDDKDFGNDDEDKLDLESFSKGRI